MRKDAETLLVCAQCGSSLTLIGVRGAFKPPQNVPDHSEMRGSRVSVADRDDLPTCVACQRSGERSFVDRLQPAGGEQFLPPRRFYGTEDGLFHVHDPNLYVQVYSCSRGHRWTVRQRVACPAGDVRGGMDIDEA
jgi:hypothetical protein